MLRVVAALLCLALGVFAAVPADAQATSRRLLQPGDELVVTVPTRSGTDQLEVQIDELGEIPLGIYGRVELAGLTEEDALRTLRSHLSGYLRSTAAVTLTLVHPRMLVYVAGMVTTPGLVTVPDSADAWTAIQAAGGTIEGADLSRVVLMHDGDERTLDLRAYLTRSGADGAPTLRPGDTVFVTAQPGLSTSGDAASAFLSTEALEGRVFVLGAVNSPGLYDLAPEMDALGALAVAGGPSADANLDQARLVTASTSTPVNIAAIIRGDAAGDPLSPDGGAILYVPHEGALAHNPVAEGISVIGGLNDAGFVETIEPLPLHEVVALAGGPTIEGNLHRVEHVHQGEQFTLVAHYNLRRYLRRGGSAGRVMIHPGDVVHINQRERPWEQFIGIVSDLAIVSSAVVVFATLGTR